MTANGPQTGSNFDPPPRQPGGSMHASFAVILLILFTWIAIPLVLAGTTLAASMAGDWAILAGIAAFLVLTSIAMDIASRIWRWGRESRYRSLFPGYEGAKFPAFDLLDGPERWKEAWRPDTMLWLGEADDFLFAIRTNRPNRRKEITRERLPLIGGYPVALSRSGILDVEVIERSDEEIKGSAVDQRDYGDRLASAIAQRVTGTRVNTRIIPYAAYVVVRTAAHELIFGIPSDVNGALIASLRRGLFVDGGTDRLVHEAAEMARERMAEGATELAGASIDPDLADAVDQVSGAAGEISWWLRPDAAQVATTDGTRGRLAAHLLAERIRAARYP